MWRSGAARPLGRQLAVTAVFLLAGAQIGIAQVHGAAIAMGCLEPRCVGDKHVCEIEIVSCDDFGDTIEVLEAWSVIDPLGDAIRVPAMGNLEIIAPSGNTTAVVGGALPVRIGPPLSTLSGLPGEPDYGVVTFGFLDPNDSRQYVIQPDDVAVLFSQAQLIVQDLCDGPDTMGCSQVPSLVGFGASTSVLAVQGDVDDDGDVDINDLTIVLADFGCLSNCPGDVDGDHDTDIGDVVYLLANFGTTCQ